MKKLLFIIGIILLSSQSIADTENAEQLNQTTVSEKVLKSTVKVGVIAHGTGWYVSENEIVTNQHVIQGAEEITFTTYDGKRCSAKLVYQEDKPDLALLSTDCKGTPLERTESHTTGQSVLAVGNPDVYDFTVTKGIVSGQKYGMIQTDARVSNGSSGGPLVDVKGRVVGVIVAKDKAYDYIGFAISMKDVNKFLERAK